MTPGTVTHVMQGHTILVTTHDRTVTILVTVNRDGKIVKPKKIDMAIQNRIMTNHISLIPLMTIVFMKLIIKDQLNNR